MQTVQVVHKYGMTGVQGIAVDWIGRKLYFVNSAEKCLRVSELDGRFNKRLLTDIHEPRGITVYPQKG